VPTPGGPRPTHVRARTVTAVAQRLGAALTGAGPSDPADPAGSVGPAGPAVEVTGTTLSSRTVRPGDLYATSVACFILAIPNRYLPILQEGKIESFKNKRPPN